MREELQGPCLFSPFVPLGACTGCLAQPGCAETSLARSDKQGTAGIPCFAKGARRRDVRMLQGGRRERMPFKPHTLAVNYLVEYFRPICPDLELYGNEDEGALNSAFLITPFSQLNSKTRNVHFWWNIQGTYIKWIRVQVGRAGCCQLEASTSRLVMCRVGLEAQAQACIRKKWADHVAQYSQGSHDSPVAMSLLDAPATECY
ncbi:hypothetical protein B0H11DRAFT_1905313 [Mycena galericulata]|nr:hypothetical protein B0H11DRAFT_1905313 [Mycena galericulata]